MRTLRLALIGIAVLVAISIAAFKVKAIDVDGFVGPDILWESDSFFSVYDLKDGHFLADVNIDANVICLKELCDDVGDLTYFGDHPLQGEHVRVHEYLLWYRWENTENHEVLGFTFVDKLPAIAHVEAVPVKFEFQIVVNGQDVGTYNNPKDAIDDAVIPAIVTAIPNH